MPVLSINGDCGDLLSKAVDFLKGFDEVVAVGLSGSAASGAADSQSDLDTCVFATPDIPNAERRGARLESAALGEIQYFDVDFETSHGDGISLNGKRCDFNWMSVPRVKRFLKSLPVDFDCDEFLPGGLMQTKAVHDPKGLIEQLRKAVPEYPHERSMHRIEKSVFAACFSLYILGWLEKAAARNDHYSFLKYKYELLDHFFTALFAVNRRWFCHEKRLVEMVDQFAHAPSRAKTRLTQVIMHTGSSASLSGCLKELKSLFSELAGISREIYPELELPTEWR